MRLLTPTLLACVLLSGCGRAQAATIDPANDVHCSVLAFYLHGLAKHEGRPDKQVRATKGLHDWYAAKMRAATGDRLKDPAVLEREVGPLLETVKADPLATREEALACMERAQADPTFDRFASAYMR